ncbi:hypothetical protein C1X91_31425, partial [Pseudomonas sp. GP01-A5]
MACISFAFAPPLGTSLRPAWFNGAPKIKIKSRSTAQRPPGRLECCKSKAKAGTVQMWERACSRRSLTMTRAFWMNAALS